MKKVLTGVAAIALAAVPTLASAASTGSHPPRAGVRIVADGANWCSSTSLTMWYRYSNGYTWTVKQRLAPGAGEFIVSHDPQGRTLPIPVLVHYTPLVCVTDALR